MNWDPLNELLAFRARATERAAQPDAAWTPTVDLLETDEAFLIFVELPGLEAGDFAIAATATTLQLTGQRPALVPPPPRYLRMERGYGRFSRLFSFGQQVDVNGISASLERGLLSITVPKAAAADRRVDIG